MRRNLLRDILLAGLGAISLLGGVLLADAVFDGDEASLPELAPLHYVPASDGDDPGAALTFVSVPAPEAIVPGATPVYPITFDDDATLQSDGSAPLDGDAGGEDVPAQPGGDQAPVPGPEGGAEVDAPAVATAEVVGTAVRFFDLCAEDSSGCPLGIAATVLYSGSVPALEVVPIPEANQALLGDLRCDPGWPTSTEIPVVILSNRPLSLLHVRLTTGAEETLIDQAVNLKSPPSEHTLYDERVNAGRATAATVESGFHTCVTLRIDRVDPRPNRIGHFELNVQAYASNEDTPGDDYDSSSIVFWGQYEGFAPPVRFYPLDENRAYLLVPQLPDDRTAVWVTEDYEAFRDQRSCEGGTPPPLDTRSTRRSPLAAPVATPGLDSPTYPWDRAYSHHTLWDLRLRNSSDYTLCVSWPGENRTEEWELETPDGFALDVYSGAFRHTSTRVPDTMGIHMLGVEGCFDATPHGQGSRHYPFPYETVYGDGTYNGMISDFMCLSGGRYIGSEIELRARFPDGEYPGDQDVYGVIRKPSNVLLGFCGALPWMDNPFSRQVAGCDTQLEWRAPRGNTLCGGGLTTPDCRGELLYSLEVSFRSTLRDSNNRPDPTDWGIARAGRYGDW